jgi:putative protease
MDERTIAVGGKTALPLIASPADEARASWQGWSPVGMLPGPDDPAIPVEPQGEYRAGSEEALELPALDFPAAVGGDQRRVELLAPAGGPEAAQAAFHFGADAVYLGLKKFSARAEAENFTIDEVDEITAYAHSLGDKRVFVTINTLVRQDEIAELVECLARLAEIGVDAIIVQDLGVYHLVRRYFPELELHASTQLAVHNRAGAEVLGRLGFTRVVLARELTFEEVRDVTAAGGVETEVFIHGALCYSYSGLCLFSSQSLGRSGNRGKCAYSCRDDYEVSGAPLELRDGSPVKRDPRHGFPFSMKDLALPDHIPALRAAGVSCFKIEGRKKSPLYVATTTDYYRRLMDGRLPPGERPALEADLQTVFSRPWTRLFTLSHKDKEVADRDTVGHRGARIGVVEGVVRAGPGQYRLRFRTSRSLQRHDGLQIDLPTQGKPVGFAVGRLWLDRGSKRREVYEAPADCTVEVGLPPEHPSIPTGAPIYCSSSQAVKQRYVYDRPKPGQFRSRKAISVHVTLTPDEIRARGNFVADAKDPAIDQVTCSLPGPFPPARDPAALEEAVRGAFDRLGTARLELAALTIHNDAGLFVPVSRLNQLRRDLVQALENALDQRLEKRIQGIKAEVCPPQAGTRGPTSPTPFQWSLKVDRLDFLEALEDKDLTGVEEIIIDIARDHPARLVEKARQWGERVGRERLRFALPALTRSWEDKGLRQKIENLRSDGWSKWEAANLSAWSYLGMNPVDTTSRSRIDLATDWSMYVLNRLVAQQLRAMGVTRFALSPEDGLANGASLLEEFGARAVVIVFQDTPLFVAESCAYANLIGGCPGKANCRFESMEMASSHGEKVTALDYHCRTIVLNQGPFCLSDRLDTLARAGAVSVRADFIYRRYEPEQVRDLWRRVRAGEPMPGGHAANFERGIL